VYVAVKLGRKMGWMDMWVTPLGWQVCHVDCVGILGGAEIFSYWMFPAMEVCKVDIEG